MTDRSIRASDRERESVVDVLRDAYMEGRLTLAEFEERTAAAYGAKTRGDLGGLTSDLPVQPSFDRTLPPRDPRSRVGRQAAPSGGLPRSRRERPLGRLLPVVFVWIVIAAAAGSPDTAAALSVMFICLLACRVGYGGR